MRAIVVASVFASASWSGSMAFVGVTRGR